jgi:hypothetical protein
MHIKKYVWNLGDLIFFFFKIPFSAYPVDVFDSYNVVLIPLQI